MTGEASPTMVHEQNDTDSSDVKPVLPLLPVISAAASPTNEAVIDMTLEDDLDLEEDPVVDTPAGGSDSVYNTGNVIVKSTSTPPMLKRIPFLKPMTPVTSLPSADASAMTYRNVPSLSRLGDVVHTNGHHGNGHEMSTTDDDTTYGADDGSDVELVSHTTSSFRCQHQCGCTATFNHKKARATHEKSAKSHPACSDPDKNIVGCVAFYLQHPTPRAGTSERAEQMRQSAANTRAANQARLSKQRQTRSRQEEAAAELDEPFAQSRRRSSRSDGNVALERSLHIRKSSRSMNGHDRHAADHNGVRMSARTNGEQPDQRRASAAKQVSPPSQPAARTAERNGTPTATNGTAKRSATFTPLQATQLPQNVDDWWSQLMTMSTDQLTYLRQVLQLPAPSPDDVDSEPDVIITKTVVKRPSITDAAPSLSKHSLPANQTLLTDAQLRERRKIGCTILPIGWQQYAPDVEFGNCLRWRSATSKPTRMQQWHERTTDRMRREAQPGQPLFEIRPASVDGAGCGIYALADIAGGTKELLTYSGYVNACDARSKPNESAYVAALIGRVPNQTRFSGNVDSDGDPAAFDSSDDEKAHKQAAYTVIEVDAERYGNESRFINCCHGPNGHTSRSPNVVFRHSIDEQTGEWKLNIDVLPCGIKAGDELLLHYGEKYWRDLAVMSAPSKRRTSSRRAKAAAPAAANGINHSATNGVTLTSRTAIKSVPAS